MGIRLARREVGQSPLACSLRRDVQKFLAEIQPRHMPSRAHALRHSDSGLARARRQVEHLHSCLRSCVLNQGVSGRAAHGRRLCLPLLRRD